MWTQANLFGSNFELPKTEKELKDVCCESCYTAKEKVCVYRCHGAYHGLGRLNKRKTEEDQTLEEVKAQCIK